MSGVEEHGGAKLELQSASWPSIFTLQSPPLQVSLKHHSLNVVLEPCGLVYLLFTGFQSTRIFLVIVCSMSLFSARVPCRSYGSHVWHVSRASHTYGYSTKACWVNAMNESSNENVTRAWIKALKRQRTEIGERSEERIKVMADGAWEVCLKIMRFQARDWKIVWAITWDRELKRKGGLGGVLKQHFLQYLLITMLFPFSPPPFFAM